MQIINRYKKFEKGLNEDNVFASEFDLSLLVRRLNCNLQIVKIKIKINLRCKYKNKQ